MNNNKHDEKTEDIVLYTVKDIKRIFSCGETVAYAIINSDRFPSFKINKRIYVHKNKLEKWIEDNRNNDIILKY